MARTRAIYKPVSNGGVGETESTTADEIDEFVFTIDGDDDDGIDDLPNADGLVRRNNEQPQRWRSGGGSHERVSLELESSNDNPLDASNFSLSDDDLSEQLFGWKDPWVPSIFISLTLTTPILLGNAWMMYSITGVAFLATPFVMHWILVLSVARHAVSAKLSSLSGTPSRIVSSVASLIDIVLLSQVYPLLWNVFLDLFFTEVDGTSSIGWGGYQRQLKLHQIQATSVVVLRCLVGVNAIGLRVATATMDSSFSDTPTWRDRYFCTCPSYLVAPFLHLDSRVLQKLVRLCCSVPPLRKRAIRRYARCVLSVTLGLAVLTLLVCAVSAARHLGTWSPPSIRNTHRCDPLDDTECWLPFPSFHALEADNSTATGWRVHLDGELLPPLKSRTWIQPDFLNELDGFSTMAPMMFYMDGLREAHEAGTGQLKSSFHIADSVTQLSATLLLDVTNSVLVPHTAEIDYLDGVRPLVLVFPAQPLYHNRHYAVAVVNANNAKGVRLQPTKGMTNLLSNAGSGTANDSDRQRRYVEVLIPSLSNAATWFRYDTDPSSLQLLFDFHTISEESQLGPVRAIRDATLRHISDPEWDWQAHVRTNRQFEYDCAQEGAILARTVHAELEVPWFLDRVGSGSRSAIVSDEALIASRSDKLGVAKFLLHIPCSVRAAALNVGSTDENNTRPLRAVMEYGHGLFGHRGEASEDHIVRMAHDQGYVVTSMDWRGMSTYDLLTVAKVLVSTPHLFQAVRDNLIQGYSCKYALQHFSRHSLLTTDWFAFKDASLDEAETTAVPKRVPTKNGKPPAFVFYGISQGGILGAGYVALSGRTGLIDRGILGSPGTPFALVMTRSLEFLNYDKLLLLNFYNNRHVRMLLTLVQMAWDSVEASGVMAPPVNEPYPRILIQTGLGDVIVSTVAAEALGRAFNASSPPRSPRQVFGIPQAEILSDTEPYVTLTELMYDDEFHHLSEDNHVPQGNAIHFCLRKDGAMIAQLSEFINTGQVVNPCTADGCHRIRVQC